jgi:hypothetical protein
MAQLDVGGSGSGLNPLLLTPQRNPSSSNFPSFAEGDNGLFGDQGGDRDCVVCLAAERTVNKTTVKSLTRARKQTWLPNFFPHRDRGLCACAVDDCARRDGAHRVLHGVRPRPQGARRPLPGLPHAH